MLDVAELMLTCHSHRWSGGRGGLVVQVESLAPE